MYKVIMYFKDSNRPRFTVFDRVECVNDQMEGFIGVDYYEDGEEKTMIYNQDSVFKLKIEKTGKR